MNKSLKTVIFWTVIVLSAFLLWQSVRNNRPDQGVTEISYSAFLAKVTDGEVGRVVITGSDVRVQDGKGGTFRVVVPAAVQPTMIDRLTKTNVEIWFRDAAEGNWSSWIMNLAPLALLAALWFFMIRQMRIRRLTGASPNSSVLTGPQ